MHVVAMGGGFGTYSFATRSGTVRSSGNVVPQAEFNIYSDAEAARVVFESEAAVTSIPLDATLQTLVPPRWLVDLARISPRCAVVAGCVDRYNAFSRKRWDHDSGPLHDPNVIAYLARPEIYGLRRGRVLIGEGARRGETRLEPDEAGRHAVALTADASRFFGWLRERLAGVIG